MWGICFYIFEEFKMQCVDILQFSKKTTGKKVIF